VTFFVNTVKVNKFGWSDEIASLLIYGSDYKEILEISGAKINVRSKREKDEERN
jgi:hypothetical protein